MDKIQEKKEKDDLKKTQMKGIIFVDVEKVICLMQLYILMLKQNILEFFQKVLQICKKKESKVLDQIVGKLIVVTAIYLKLMNLIKDLKNLLI